MSDNESNSTPRRKTVPDTFSIPDKWVGFAFIILLVAFSTLMNYCYVKWDATPVNTDFHAIRSMEYWYDMMDSGFDVPMTHPPMVFWITQWHYIYLGISLETARLSMLLYNMIFLLSMYGIGRKLGGITGGICVSTLSASSPHIVNLSHCYFLDPAQNAFTALSLWLMLKSDYFSKPVYSILMGITIGISMLCKWSTVFYILMPFIWLGLPAVFKSWKSLMAFLGVAGFVCYALMKILTFTFAFSLYEVREIWFDWYRKDILIPSMFLILLVFIGLHILKRIDRNNKTGLAPVFNMWACICLAFMITAPWFYWSSATVLIKFQNEMVNKRILHDNIQSIIIMLKTAFFLAPPLMAIGTILIFAEKKRIYERLFAPISLIFSIVVMANLSFPPVRYQMSLLIFAFILGGYWIGMAGRLKKPITIFLVFLSLISMSGWTFDRETWNNCSREITMDEFATRTDSGYLVPKLLFPIRPEKTFFDISTLIKRIKPDTTTGQPVTVLFKSVAGASFRSPFYEEELYFSVLKNRVRVVIVGFSHDSVRDMLINKKPDYFYILALEKNDDPATSAIVATDFPVPGYKKTITKIKKTYYDSTFSAMNTLEQPLIDYNVYLVTLKKSSPKAKP